MTKEAKGQRRSARGTSPQEREEAGRLREELAVVERPTRTRPYPSELRARVVAHVERRRGAGTGYPTLARELGLCIKTLRDWTSRPSEPLSSAAQTGSAEASPSGRAEPGDVPSPEGGRRSESPSFVAVRVARSTEAPSSGLTLFAPDGYRLEGLSAEEAVRVLTGLSERRA